MTTLTDARAFRAAQLAFIEDKFSNLVEDDLGLKDTFLDLCCQTHVSLGEKHWSHRACFRPCASSALNLSFPVNDMARKGLSKDLQKRWFVWKDDYARLTAHNPRLDLADRLQDISEMNDASSWLYGHEENLKAWVDGGDNMRFPFRMRPEFPTHTFYRELRDLRRGTGGWLY